ncbi:MAG TPA: L-threonylcarbamoyladenylate synthase [Gaiellaceae bacterium]|nr:L-threonylcarbamoyladenylate synthase [Gaiellaceae bacterium]
MSSVEETVAAITAGKLAVIPTDTVYGLACAPEDESAVRALSRLKRRPTGQPVALVAASVDHLTERVPELRGRAEKLARGLLPGPFTLVLPNPARRYAWLTGERPLTIGVRVPELAGMAQELLAEVAAVAATSANRHGGADPRRLADVPRDMLDAVAALLDGGELPGTPSTVLDLTRAEPRVLREGAVRAADALARVDALLAQ